MPRLLSFPPPTNAANLQIATRNSRNNFVQINGSRNAQALTQMDENIEKVIVGIKNIKVKSLVKTIMYVICSVFAIATALSYQKLSSKDALSYMQHFQRVMSWFLDASFKINPELGSFVAKNMGLGIVAAFGALEAFGRNGKVRVQDLILPFASSLLINKKTSSNLTFNMLTKTPSIFQKTISVMTTGKTPGTILQTMIINVLAQGILVLVWSASNSSYKIAKDTRDIVLYSKMVKKPSLSTGNLMKIKKNMVLR